jgi:hypothetical protein
MPAVDVQSPTGDKFFGFHAILEEALSNTALAAGTNYLDGAAVPAGEIWWIGRAAIVYSGTVPTRMLLYPSGLATYLPVLQQLAPVSGQWYLGEVGIYIQVGDFMRLEVTGATLNDDMYLRYAGLKMYAL